MGNRRILAVSLQNVNLFQYKKPYLKFKLFENQQEDIY